eukprot:13178586-Alexandrium_andersonii.AAC.1
MRQGGTVPSLRKEEVTAASALARADHGGACVGLPTGVQRRARVRACLFQAGARPDPSPDISPCLRQEGG